MTKAEEVIEALAPMFRCPLCQSLILAVRYAEGNRGRSAAGDCTCKSNNGALRGTGRWDLFGDLDEWMAAGQP